MDRRRAGGLRFSAPSDAAEIRHAPAQAGRVQGRAADGTSPCRKGDRGRRGTGRPAVSAAGARRKNRGFRPAGAHPCAAGRPFHHLGGLCHHGDGRKGAGCQHSAGSDFAAHPLSDRGAPLAAAVLPSDRSGDETAGASDACCAKIHRISLAAGSAALSGAGTAAENR